MYGGESGLRSPRCQGHDAGVQAREARLVSTWAWRRRTVPGRFRDNLLDADKLAWERKGDGLVPLEPDTEPVQNINEHR